MTNSTPGTYGSGFPWLSVLLWLSCAFSKCLQMVHSSGQRLVQEKVSTLWWYCSSSSAAALDRSVTLKHPWQIKGRWTSGQSSTEDSKSLNYVVSMLLTAKRHPVPRDSLSLHTL